MLSNARLKLDRAKKHIADVQAIIAGLPDRYTATTEINPKAGNPVIKHDLRDRREIASELALIIGDAIHNLKCALDYAWGRSLGKIAPYALTGFTKFPVYPSSNQLEATLRKREIDTFAPVLFDLVISKLKPYEGGNDSIWAIHRLDILDKHRLLIPVVEFVGIEDIEVENERGERVRGFSWATLQKPPYYVPIEAGWHINDLPPEN